MIMLTFMVMNLGQMLSKALSFCVRCHFAVKTLLIRACSRLIGDGLCLVRYRPCFLRQCMGNIRAEYDHGFPGVVLGSPLV